MTKNCFLVDSVSYENDNDRDSKSPGHRGDIQNMPNCQEYNPKMAENWFCEILSQKRVPEVHYRCIGEAMTGNDKLTASELRDILSKKFGAQKFKYSMRTVARLPNELVSSTILGCAGQEVF